MKKLLIIIAISLAFACESNIDKGKELTHSKEFYTFTNEGHEYLAKDNMTYYAMYVTTFTHKGGCKACKK